MTYEELKGWHAYFERRPPEWRDDDRTAKLLQAQGAKVKPWEIFPSLKAIYNSIADDNPSSTAPKGLKGSFMGHLMMSSKGGDKIAFEE
jgi:hypothetical protein